MTEQHDFEIDPTSNLHQFFAQVTTHVPSAIQDQVGSDDISNYINNFIIVTDINRDYQSDLIDIQGITEELTYAVTRPNVEMNFVHLRLNELLQPIWIFECTCSLTDGYEVMGLLVFNSQQLIRADLLSYLDSKHNEIQADQTSPNWLYEAQSILLKI